ncbi:MAG: biotin/lipoyl-binding protein [Oligoflexales bacterium]|nr:biotin/lipoyl-binding protein [Oligoflexales bacterium]
MEYEIQVLGRKHVLKISQYPSGGSAQGRDRSYLVQTEHHTYKIHWNPSLRDFLVERENSSHANPVLEQIFHLKASSKTSPRPKGDLRSQGERSVELEISAGSKSSWLKAKLCPLSISRAKPDAAAQEGSYAFQSPITGKILKVFKEENSPIQAGDLILMIEAMKMENKISADSAGTLTRVLIKEGDQVKMGDDLFFIEAAKVPENIPHR